jgi:small subunit ribosomal protein S4
MARYTEPLCKLCRREREKLFLKADRCFTEKCSVERRKYPPGQHGQRRGKLSDYGVQLREKQKVRHSYSVLEKQFRRYFSIAERRKGVTGEVLLQMLERRLDNMVFRMGFAANRRQGRQLVTHGFFMVNGRAVSIPSYIVRAGDVIEVKEKGRKLPAIEENISKAQHRGMPSWLEVEAEKFRGRVASIPTREEIPLPAQEQMIIELYSK